MAGIAQDSPHIPEEVPKEVESKETPSLEVEDGANTKAPNVPDAPDVPNVPDAPDVPDVPDVSGPQVGSPRAYGNNPFASPPPE